jgi:hypothetical protein
MLIWHKELWLIDHGASLYFHHSWTNWEKHAQSPFALIKDHVLLPQASMLQEADALFKTILTPETLQAIVNLIPLEWLDWQDTDESPDAIREVYLQFYRCACIILKFSLKKLKMQEKHLYEYSVIRVVPRVEREEFLNVGLLFCKKRSL